MRMSRLSPLSGRSAVRSWRSGLAPQVIKLPAGEGTKSWAQLEALTDRLIELGVERSDHVIALGGGVIGDLVGFRRVHGEARLQFHPDPDHVAGSGR